MNTGIDSIIEIGNLNINYDPVPQVFRFLVQFDQSEIEDVIDNKITQEEFAKYLLVNVSYIKAVESKRFTPSFSVIRRWKKRFRVSYEWIIEG